MDTNGTITFLLVESPVYNYVFKLHHVPCCFLCHQSEPLLSPWAHARNWNLFESVRMRPQSLRWAGVKVFKIYATDVFLHGFAITKPRPSVLTTTLVGFLSVRFIDCDLELIGSRSCSGSRSDATYMHPDAIRLSVWCQTTRSLLILPTL